MTQYRLHSFAESGNSYRVALMLAAVGAEWEPVFVDFFHGGARTPDFLALNSMGEAPVLETPDGVLTQSGAILHYLARTHRRYGGDTDAEADQVLRWILWDNHKLGGVAGIYRFMTNFLPADKRDPAVIGYMRGRLLTTLKVLEAHLAAQDFVALPEQPTIADMSCCGYLYFMDEMDLEPSDYPATSAWLDRVRSLPGWRHPYDMLPRAWRNAAP